MITREELDHLLDAFQDAIMEVVIRQERNRPPEAQKESAIKAVESRDAIYRALGLSL